MKHRFIITLMALVSLMAVTACNTMEGLGKDIQKGGQKLEDAAASNNNSNPQPY